jgi:hypothetical protein
LQLLPPLSHPRSGFGQSFFRRDPDSLLRNRVKEEQLRERGATAMKSHLITICGVATVALLGGCASSPGYSPPPERRAAEQCPMGETWICPDRYPSRLPGQDEVPTICYCGSLQRLR